MHVDVHHPPRRQIVLVDKAPDLHDSRVVDEHIQGAELLFCAIEEGREGVSVGDVERQCHGARAEL